MALGGWRQSRQPQGHTCIHKKSVFISRPPYGAFGCLRHLCPLLARGPRSGPRVVVAPSGHPRDNGPKTLVPFG